MGYTLDAEEVGDFSELVGKDMLSYMQYDFGQGSRRLLVWPRFVLEGGRCRKIAASALPDVGGLPTVVSAHGWDRYRIERVYGRMCIAVLNTPDVNMNTNYGLSEPHRYNAAVNPNMRSSVLEFKRFETTPFSVQMAQVINVAGGLIDFSKPIDDLVHPYPWQAQPQCRHVLISQTGADGRRLLWGPFEVGDAVEGACSVQASKSYDLLVRAVDASRFSDRVELLDDEGIPFAEFVSISELDGLLAEPEAEYDWMGDDELVASLARLAKAADKPATRREMQSLRAALSAASEVEAAALAGGRRERMAALLDAAESWAAMADEAKREAVEAMPAEQVAAFVLDDESFAGFMRRALEDDRVKERYDRQRAALAAEAERERGRLDAVKGELASAEEDLARAVSERGEVMEQVRAEHAAEIAEAEQRLAGLEAAVQAAEGRVDELRQAEFAAKQAVANVMDGFRNEFKAGEKVLESVMAREIVAALGAPQPAASSPVPVDDEPPAAPPAPAMLAGAAEMAPTDVLERICGLVREVGGRDLSRNEVANLVICLVQGYVTVLAGMPGAGKTSLAGILAGALGLRQPGAPRYCEVPVERGWASYKDFIGYHNPLTQRIEAASSAAFAAFEEMTREAAAGAGDPAMRLVLLDEANLSSMEHYFSPFMMACDRFADGPFSIELGGGESFTAPEHLRFIATVNFDHTTEELSPRFLDRAWTVMLEAPGELGELCAAESAADWAGVDALPARVLSAAFGPRAGGVPAAMEDKLGEVLRICAARRRPVSPRSMIMMRDYLSAAAAVMDTESAEGALEAVDFAVCQKVLPRIGGPAGQVEGLLEDLARVGGLPRARARAQAMLERGDGDFYQFFA